MRRGAVPEDEFESRRAKNIVWNIAHDHTVTPAFLAFNAEFRADLYLNCVVGAVHRHLEWEKLSILFRQLEYGRDRNRYTDYLWLALEHCVFLREIAERPALEALRKEYARTVTTKNRGRADQRQFERVYDAHFCRVLGENPRLYGEDLRLLNDLEFPVELDTDAIIERTLALFKKYFRFQPTPPDKLRARKGNPFFAIGRSIIQPIQTGGGSSAHTRKGLRLRLGRSIDPEQARLAIEQDFGPSFISVEKRIAIEQEICRDDHANCKIHVTIGSAGASPMSNDTTGQNSESTRRKTFRDQRDKNAAFFRANRTQLEFEIQRLERHIRNSLNARKDPELMQSRWGTLDTKRAWRAIALGDGRVFSKTQIDENDPLSVDIFLDASLSLTHRQETVAAQAYVIAEAISRCGIPIRVSSFCTVDDFTVIHQFRDYTHSDGNAAILQYATAGWNRDGLALRALRVFLRESRAERKLAIILSDANPNDENDLTPSSFAKATRYDGKIAIEDTAREARAIRAEGTKLVCAFIGPEDGLRAVRAIYGTDFTRIPGLERFADAMGALIKTQLERA